MKTFVARPAIWTLCAALLAASSAYALDPSQAVTQYSLRVLQNSDGLPQNAITAIAQTKDGYLWFGTQEGLARFDGVRFTVFDKRNTPAFASNHQITGLLVSRDGALWISRNDGISRYHDGRFTTFASPEGLSRGFMWSLAEGADGSIWMASYSVGLVRFHGGKFTALTTKEGLVASSVWSTYVSRDGTLWAGTNGGGLSRFANGRFSSFTTKNGLAHDIVFAISEDRSGAIWIGTNDGLNRYQDGKITTFTTADGLSNNSIRALREDRNGNLWIGTEGGGLNRYSRGVFTSLGVSQGLSNASVISLLEDREGSLWAGTYGGGVNQLLSGKVSTITRTEGVIGELVWSVREARDGALLVGTNDGFTRWKDGRATNLTTREGLSSNVVRAILEDSNGALWLGTGDGLNRYANGRVTVYRTADGLSHDIIRTLFEDREGNVWIGTRGGGATRYRDGVFTVMDGKSGFADVVETISQDADGSLWFSTVGGVQVLQNGKLRHYGTRDGLSNESVRVTHHDRDGAHWIGTYGGGLNRLKNGRITAITSRDGLFDDLVYSILEDDRGYLWMSCNRGIFRVRKAELNDFADGKIKRIHSTSFGVADGMKDAECNGGSPAGWKGRDGRLFFPTGRGVVIIDPKHLPTNSIAPNVLNEAVLVDGRVVAVPAAGLLLKPRRRSLEIRYSAPSFIAAKKVTFRYRLEGFSDDWIDAGDRRTAFYTNLSPGDYAFEVMARNNDGIWSRPRRLPIHIEAAFYETAWFYAACVALALLAVGAGVRMRLRILERRERELRQRVDAQTEELRRANGHNQLILNSAGEGIFGLDRDGKATFINPFAARMLGCSVDELVGRPLHDIIHSGTDTPDDQRLCVICSATMQPATRIALAANFRNRAGKVIPVECTASSLTDESGKPAGVVVTFRDVSERLVVERLKQEFVSTVSHELRTPLTSIRGALGLLAAGLLGSVGDRGQRMLKIAVTNTDRLVRLINDILDLERIDSGQIGLTLTSLSANDLVTEAVEGVLAMAEQAGVAIVRKPCDALLSADHDRIIQVLTNLLSNAIKFSPPGTTVAIDCAPVDGFLLFRVADQGRGVPEEKLETIFDRFQQVDASDARDKGGTGLGLAICRSIVNAHGGRIWAQRGSDRGAVLQFTVRLAQAVIPSAIEVDTELLEPVARA
jgi:PAS domain S-box-containing protein